MADVLGEGDGGVVRALDQRRLDQLPDGQPLAGAQLGRRLADLGRLAAGS